jgi:hypothetical protein
LNGGVRYDWQTSKMLAGCLPAATIDIRHPVTGAHLLPAQCQDETDTDPVTGEKLRAFSQFAPRLSATYDLLGNGKTQVHASYSLYYSTKITLANQLNNLGFVGLSWGNMADNGTCANRTSTTSNSSCWQDLNLDGFVQPQELSWVQGSLLAGAPTFLNMDCLPGHPQYPNCQRRLPSGPGRFNIDTGVLTPGRNSVDNSAKIGRTREAIVGIQHELIPNLAVGVDYVYRKYDRGTQSYNQGQQPGCETSTDYPCVAPFAPLASIYTIKNIYTDPVTGISAPYYTIPAGTVVQTGLSSVTMTSLNYQVYQGVILQGTKRFSDRWQMQTSVTIQTNPGYNVFFTNPTGVEFTNGRSTIARYLFKMNGAYSLPWGVMVSGNLNINDGANRTLSINGPGNNFPTGAVSQGGNSQTVNYSTLNFQPTGTTRLQPIKLLDMGVAKTFALRGGKNRLKVMLDGFNLFNINTITGWNSSNMSSTGFTQPSNIVPPRVVRFGAQIGF